MTAENFRKNKVLEQELWYINETFQIWGSMQLPKHKLFLAIEVPNTRFKEQI